jgi:hypothetical protein
MSKIFATGNFSPRKQEGEKYSSEKSLLSPSLSAFSPNVLVLRFSEFVSKGILQPILVAALSKTWVCGRTLPGIVGSNPGRDMYVRIL